MTELTKGTFSVNTKEDLTKESTWIINGVNILGSEGAQVFCLSDSKVYILGSNDFTQESNWKEVKEPEGESTPHDLTPGTEYKRFSFKDSVEFTSPEDIALFDAFNDAVTSLPEDHFEAEFVTDSINTLSVVAEYNSDSFGIWFGIGNAFLSQPTDKALVSYSVNSTNHSISRFESGLDATQYFAIASFSNALTNKPITCSWEVGEDYPIQTLILKLVEAYDSDIIE